jgi:hypothetical protein
VLDISKLSQSDFSFVKDFQVSNIRPNSVAVETYGKFKDKLSIQQKGG